MSIHVLCENNRLFWLEHNSSFGSTGAKHNTANTEHNPPRPNLDVQKHVLFKISMSHAYLILTVNNHGIVSTMGAVFIIIVGYRPFFVQNIPTAVHFSLGSDKAADQLPIIF